MVVINYHLINIGSEIVTYVNITNNSSIYFGLSLTVMISSTEYTCLFCDIFSLSAIFAAFSMTCATQVGPPNLRLHTAVSYASVTACITCKYNNYEGVNE